MSIKKDWRDFKSINGGIAGAREAFEDACETLFRKEYEGKHVSQVSVNQGDGGIDIFVGEFGEKEITVIQCKFFLESFQDSQKNQIRDSFKTAVEAKNYKLKEWILCIPRVIDIDENSWWFKWKHKKIKELNKEEDFIKIINGNEIIDLMKEHDIYNTIFQIDDSIKLNELHEAICGQKQKNSTKSIEKPNIILFNNYSNKCEDYYCIRSQDNDFNETLLVSNIWVSGESGKGKTALINRNLIQKNIEYVFCDLSPITITSPDNILEEVICNIEEIYDTKRTTEKNLIKSIVKLLNVIKKDKIVIVIDELSCDDPELLKNIASIFLSLVSHYNNKNQESELRFVVSTKIKPEILIQNKSKASEYFQYLCCDSWDEYFEKLFDTLNISLGLNISNEDKQIVIRKANNSPRILKNILKKLIINKEDDLIKIIEKTIDESI